MQLDSFVEKVLAEGALHYRDLPWRRTRDPYAVMLSEVMLQQTQVARVDGRWQAWLEKFPTVEALAAAPLNAVLSEWQGMGYNRRAVNLQRCAHAVVEGHGGAVPSGYAELVALPGIGPATAAGVRAFAFCEPGIYLETNVRTVLIHELFPERDDVADVELRPILEACCPPAGEDVRRWYYALLDYGAYLKSVMPNPSRRSRHYTRQSKFEGSHRQKRAFLLRRLIEGPTTAADLAADLSAFELEAGRNAVDEEQVAAILAELARDGMAELRGTAWHCAE